MFNRKIFLPLILLLLAVPVWAQLELPRASPKATLSQRIGLTDLTITYSRPSVRGRTIWGGLVPYDQVWRTGANEATTFEVSDDVMINGSKLSKGKYSLATIPGKTEWTIIFNKEAELWGAFEYDPSKDALRVKATPRTVDHMHESMMFVIPEVTAESATVALAWEKLMVPFKVEVDTKAKVQSNIQSALARMEDWRTPYQAANYAFQSDGNMADAMKWIDRSIALKETYQNVNLKARMLAKQGNTREAITTAERALKLARAATPPVDTAEFEKQVAEWKTKARM